VSARIGQYDLLEQLGKGPHGGVHLSVDTRHDQMVALKFYESADVPIAAGRGKEFYELARAYTAVNSPYFGTIKAVSDPGETPCYVSREYVNGVTLRALRYHCKSLARPFSAAILHSVAAGLAAIHGVGQIHSNLKLTNIMVQQAGGVKLVDPMLATPRLIGAANRTINYNSGLFGSPAFLAPEQLAGGEVTAATDAYSFGVLAYLLLTGRYPIEEPDLGKLRRLKLKGEYVAPHAIVPDIPPPLAQVVDDCLKRNPQTRESDLGQVAERLKTWLAHAGASPAQALLEGAQAVSYVFMMSASKERKFPGPFQSPRHASDVTVRETHRPLPEAAPVQWPAPPRSEGEAAFRSAPTLPADALDDPPPKRTSSALKHPQPAAPPPTTMQPAVKLAEAAAAAAAEITPDAPSSPHKSSRALEQPTTRPAMAGRRKHPKTAAPPPISAAPAGATPPPAAPARAISSPGGDGSSRNVPGQPLDARSPLPRPAPPALLFAPDAAMPVAPDATVEEEEGPGRGYLVAAAIIVAGVVAWGLAGDQLLDQQGAETTDETLTATTPLSPEQLLEKAREAADGPPREAVAAARAAAEALPENGDAQVLLARAHIRAGSYNDANRALERAQLLLPETAEPTRLGVRLLLDKGLNGPAAIAARKALNEHGTDAPLYVLLARALLADRKVDEAIEALATATQLDGDSAEAFSLLGEAHFQKGAYVKAREAYKRAVELRPRSAPAYVGLGKTLMALGRGGDAADMLVHGLTFAPDSQELHYAVGRVLVRDGRDEDANVHLQTYVSKYPDDWRGYFSLGLSQLRRGANEPAAQSFRNAATRRPNQAEIQYDLGVALTRTNKPDAALAAFSEAIKLRYGLWEAHCERAKLQHARNALADARSGYEQALKLNGNCALAKSVLDTKLASSMGRMHLGLPCASKPELDVAD